MLLPSRDQTGRDAAQSEPRSHKDQDEESDDSGEELPPDVLLGALLGQLRPVREHLAKGGAVDARAPGRAGGGWTLLMAAAEGGKDGRLRYEQQSAAYSADLRARAERRRQRRQQQQEKVAAKAAAKAAAKERYTKAYAAPAGAPAGALASPAAAPAAAAAAAAAPDATGAAAVAAGEEGAGAPAGMMADA